jgi:hypothetical protein
MEQLRRWMVHHDDKWVPLTAPNVAFLMGINQKRRSRGPSCVNNMTWEPRHPERKAMSDSPSGLQTLLLAVAVKKTRPLPWIRRPMKLCI